MIKAVVFDVTGVLCSDDIKGVFERTAQRLGLDAREVSNFAKEHIADWLLGATTLAGSESLAMEKFHRPDFWDVWHEEYLAATKINSGLYEMIEKLKGRYLLAVLTNNSEHRMRADEHLGIYKPFDKVYQSCKIGLKKPNADFYQYAQRDIGVASDEILFVDDVARNVDAARLLGWHAFRYESLDSFATELLAHGVKID